MGFVSWINFMWFLIFLTISVSTIFLSTPLSMVVQFLLVSSLVTYYLYSTCTDFMSYLLFLVYVGGLLVLMIYTTMMSSNYILDFSQMTFWLTAISMTFMLSMSFYYLGVDFFTSIKSSSSSALNLIEYSSIPLAGTFLFFVFYNVCTMICLGGRSVNISANT